MHDLGLAIARRERGGGQGGGICRQNQSPEEGRLHHPDGLSIPAKLLGHGQHCDAHIDAVHVAQHECEEAQRHDGPPPFPAGGHADNLHQENFIGQLPILMFLSYRPS